MVAHGLYCATCHQEHQGLNFKLNKISNEQCRSCHVVKFDSFDGHHPKFENYPFKRRTRIIYDHAGHFGKHYPEVAKKDPDIRIPDTCSTCHNSREDKRVMAVAPFEQNCTACHLDQIIGKERASGPKGIAFLSLPGLDLETLKKKNAPIGEWPDASEAALTPFMKVMISRNEQGRALIKTVDSLNLQDLSNASDDQIKAVTSLVWEIKEQFYKLISGKASDVLGDLNIGGGAKLAANLVADLTASIPRDVVISAHQEWLPNLATEMANRPVASNVTSDQEQSGWGATITESNLTGSASPEQQSGWDARIDPYGRVTEEPKDEAEAATATAAQPEGAAGETDTANAKPEGGKETLSASPEAADSKAASKAIPNEQACTVSIFGQCVLSKGPADEAEAVKSEGAAGQTDATSAPSDGAASPDSASKADAEAPADAPAGSDAAAATKDAEKAGQPEGAAGKTYITNAGPEDGTEAPSSEEGGGGPIIKRFSLPSGTSRAIEGSTKDGKSGAEPEGAARKSDAAKAKPEGGQETPSGDEQPPATKASKDTERAAQPESAASKYDAANDKPDVGKETPSAIAQPQGNAADQKDDLLFPTEEELRAIKAGSKDTEKAAQPEEAAGETDTTNAKPDGGASADTASKADANAPADALAGSDAAAARPQTRAAPVISIKSDVDPESWAEYGGWYQQDYAIFYRPTGHKDKFIYSWLFLTGPQAPKGDTSPAAAVFDVLTGKDAQGSCTKCHSVDEIQGKGRLVNFSPPSVASKQGRFTNFIHEPHFGLLETRVALENRIGVVENRGCLTCHNLEKGRPYLKSYEQGNPQNFVSNFGEVKKDLCQTCHTNSMARQDCLTCHKYHVNGVITPIISTKLPTQ